MSWFFPNPVNQITEQRPIHMKPRNELSLKPLINVKLTVYVVPSYRTSSSGLRDHSSVTSHFRFLCELRPRIYFSKFSERWAWRLNRSHYSSFSIFLFWVDGVGVVSKTRANQCLADCCIKWTEMRVMEACDSWKTIRDFIRIHSHWHRNLSLRKLSICRVNEDQKEVRVIRLRIVLVRLVYGRSDSVWSWITSPQFRPRDEETTDSSKEFWYKCSMANRIVAVFVAKNGHIVTTQLAQQCVIPIVGTSTNAYR